MELNTPLIGSLISVALVAGASLIGDEFCALFMGIKNTIQTGVTPVVSVPC